MVTRMRSVGGFFRRLVGAVSGTAAVEFSLFLFFILMPFLFGIFEIGRALEQHHVVTKSVRDAARFVARTRDDSGDAFTTDNPIDVGCLAAGTVGGAPSGPAAAGNAKNLAMYGVFNPVWYCPRDPDKIPKEDDPLMAAWDAACDPAPYLTVCIDGPVEVITNTSSLKIDVVIVTATVPFEDILLRAFGIGPITFEVSHEQRHIGE